MQILAQHNEYLPFFFQTSRISDYSFIQQIFEEPNWVVEGRKMIIVLIIYC